MEKFLFCRWKMPCAFGPAKRAKVPYKIIRQIFNFLKEGSMSPASVLALAKEYKAKMVDFKFIDMPGIWQHFSVPLAELTEASFEEGFGFDGSSIRGWQPIHASDMLIKPDPITAVMDPFMEIPTLSITCTIHDPMTG